MILPVTVVIPVKNEQRNLPNCLEALGDYFTEVVVVDSGSSDDTKGIAERFGAKVLEFSWDGTFPKKRNWVLRNHHFETAWVLFLDADERVTPEFIQELGAVLPTTTKVGFWLRYRNWFMEEPLRYGDTMRKLALFRKDAGEYERLEENSWSEFDMEIHEHPILEGEAGEIRSALDHHDYRGLHHYIGKHNEYSTWESNRYFWLHRSSQDRWKGLTARQRFKYRNLDKWWLGRFYFFISYFLKLGLLDGRVGWTFNRLKLRYFNDIRLKIRESRQG